MSLESFLEGIRTELSTDLSIEIVDGEVEGPLTDIPDEGWGCVWPERTEELVEDVMWEEYRVHVRLFLRYDQQFTPEDVADTSDLMDLRARTIAALKDKQSNQLGVWFFRPESWDFAPRQRYIEAVLVGRQMAEFTWGA